MTTQHMIIPAAIWPLPDLKKATTTNELYDIVESVLMGFAYHNSPLSWDDIAYDISIDDDFDGQCEIVEFLQNAETLWFDLDKNC